VPDTSLVLQLKKRINRGMWLKMWRPVFSLKILV